MRESDTLLHWWLKTHIHIQLFSPSLVRTKPDKMEGMYKYNKE